MKILDCESIETAYKSLEAILGLAKYELCQLFDSVKVYGREDVCETYWDFLLSYIREKTGCKTDFDKACFFQAGCTWEGNKYEDGLLPTSQAIKKIFKFLSIVDNSHFECNTEVQNKFINGGPFGNLIKDIAFVSDSGYFNYFDSPEIIVDAKLKKDYKAKTLPCIVKFTDQWTSTTETWEPTTVLGKALLYTYCDHHDLKLAPEADLACGFDGRNVTVPYSNIDNVYFYKDDDIPYITS